MLILLVETEEELRAILTFDDPPPLLNCSNLKSVLPEHSANNKKASANYQITSG